MIFRELRAALGTLIVFTLLTGLAYPLAITEIADRVMPRQAGGSLVSRDGVIVGSELIGQTFTRPDYFHGRPSAAGSGYDAANSGASNLAIGSGEFVKTVTARVKDLRDANDEHQAIPIDLVTASGSGLDPDLSPAAAIYQAGRVAHARALPLQQVQSLITAQTEPRLWDIWGEPRVNVLAINRALDALTASAPLPTP